MTLTRRRFLQVTAGVGAVVAIPGLRSAARAVVPAPTGGVWLAGDFHVHTTYSHDVWSGPGDDNTTEEDFYTLGWTPAEQIQIAETRGLDFVALTDHSRTDALRDPGYTSDKLILVPGYEHSLSGGHAGVFVRSTSDLPDQLRDDDGSTGFVGEDGLQRFLDRVHALQGVTVLNHPTSDGAFWNRPAGLDTRSLGFDAVEAWNGRWQQRAETVPFSYSDNYKAVPWWEDNFLRDGHRHLGITGGSDNHWRSVTAVAGVGQPTTWVYAADRSPAAIIDAVRNGRTFVSAEPPLHQGPKLFLTADDAMVGGEIPPLGASTVRVTVEGGSGQRVRLISTGNVVAEWLVVGPSSQHETSVVLPEGGWLRAELLVEPGFLVTAVTSPIFAGAIPAPLAVAPTPGVPVTYTTPPITLPEVHCC
ncbi:MAG: hypothetical protein QOF00_5911 [Pseudonocardiales bacterium]|nr:hypothetical protein [Pseudonocardiales bacterium]